MSPIGVCLRTYSSTATVPTMAPSAPADQTCPLGLGLPSECSPHCCPDQTRPHSSCLLIKIKPSKQTQNPHYVHSPARMGENPSSLRWQLRSLMACPCLAIPVPFLSLPTGPTLAMMAHPGKGHCFPSQRVSPLQSSLEPPLLPNPCSPRPRQD